MTFKDLIIYLGYFILTINVILYFKSYRNNSVAFKILTIYLSFSLVIQLLSAYIATYRGNNIFLLHFFNIGQFLLISLFFFKDFRLRKNKKIVFATFFLAFFIYFFIVVKTDDYFYKFNIPEIFTFSIPLIVYSFILFLQKVDVKSKKFIYFNSGFFIYTLCFMLMFSAGSISSEIKYVLWNINAAIYVLYQILVFVEWYKNFRKKPVK